MAAAAVLVIVLLAATRSGQNGGSPQSSGQSSHKTTGQSRVDSSFLGTWRGSIDQQGDPNSVDDGGHRAACDAFAWETAGGAV